MFSHITIGSRDLQRSARFFDAVLRPLGLEQRVVEPDGGPPSLCWCKPGQRLPRFYIYSPFDGNPASAGNGNMAAFLAPSPEAVNEAYTAALATGGTDCGPPGERPHYAVGYYGAYVHDPDGNKIHFVHRGDLVG